MTMTPLSRRLLLGSAGAMLLPGFARATSIEVTPQCDDGDEPTPAQTAGPYYTPNSPERRSLVEDGMEGQRMTLSGFALDRKCQPVANALIDLWHCDATGTYDNTGFRLRGHQFTNAQGYYEFETIVPGLYPGRTRHFHIKVQAPQQKVLTTQLYFLEEPGNARDRIFNDALQMGVRYGFGGGEDLAYVYDFILDMG